LNKHENNNNFNIEEFNKLRDSEDHQL
jgi:hypothetical protein